MTKARVRTSAKKVKDKWRSKGWYKILAPPAFDSVAIAETLADTPESLMGRVTEVSLQDMTNDFRQSHVKLFFKVNKIEDTNASTMFAGHTLTSDYLRRMVRRRRSKIDGVYDVTTRDGAKIRVKPFATTDKRVQSSQKKAIREAMKKTIYDQAANSTLSEFVKTIIDGKMGSEIYKGCKNFYPVKRIEIFKTEVTSPPTMIMEEKKPKREEKTGEPVLEPEIKEEKPEEKVEQLAEIQEERPIEEEKPVEETEEEPKEKEKLEAKKLTKKTVKKEKTTEKKTKKTKNQKNKQKFFLK
jgi:small subunit ribosomal protein S3Ae